MEVNHPLWSATDYLHHHQDIVVRSFKCSFCKRGFSNAQALGGHMNIHRKDRARLRQLSCNDDIDDAADEHNISNYHHRIRHLKRSSNRERENHSVQQPQQQQQQQQQQLPLFIQVEASQWVAGCDHDMVHGRHHDENYDEDEDLFPELDLELRLGPERDHRMPACLGTRNFF